MKPRERVGPKATKSRRHKRVAPKRRAVGKIPRNDGLSARQDRIDQLTRELREALEQQTASGEILASMSGSMTDAKPVFDAIVRNLLRLFGTRFATVQLLQDGIIHMPAADGQPGFEKLMDYYPRPLDYGTAGGEAIRTKQVVQYSPIRDNPAVPALTRKFAHGVALCRVP